MALTFRTRAWALGPTIELIEQARQAGATIPPVSWRFTDESEERPYPIIDIVAGPGISIEFRRFPEVAFLGPGIPRVNILRVQDVDLVPRIASGSSFGRLLGGYEIADHTVPAITIGPDAEGPLSISEKHFSVRRLTNGVDISDLWTGIVWHVEVPLSSDSPRTSSDALARYAYEFDLNAERGSSSTPLIRIVKTPEVSITAAIPRARSDRHRLELAFATTTEVWEVPYIHLIPTQGDSLSPSEEWSEVTSVDIIGGGSNWELELQRAAFDTAVGLVPVAGDLVDISELVLAVTTGSDRYGRRVSGSDLAIMALGSLLPFVSSSALRSGRRLARRFGARRREAERLIENVADARLTKDEARLIKELEELLSRGRTPSASQWAKAMRAVERIPSDQRGLEVLLNLESSGFVHAELQEAYRRYRSRQVAAGTEPASPEVWARRVTTGRPRRLLEAALGADYARRPARLEASLLHLDDVPRPADYSLAALRRDLEVARGNAVSLMERLDGLVAEGLRIDQAGLVSGLTAASAGRFRILKGNVAELFSLDIQLEQLQRIGRLHKDASLVRGVKVRLARETGLGQARLFSDNVIVAERGGMLQMLAVFEVKSGYGGGQEATEQIFEWIEGRLSDGSELVLPKGAEFIAASGRRSIAATERRFVWKPAKPSEGRQVIGLAGAERHIVAARGTSLLGQQSAMSVAAPVIRHELTQSSADLDYLCAAFLSGREIPRNPLDDLDLR